MQRLVDAWEASPHRRLAAALAASPVVPFSGDVDAWCVAARTATGAEARAPLIATLFTGTLAEVQRKLDAIPTWRDARLSNELERVLREPPWSANSSRPVWERVFTLVTASRDARFTELAREVPKTWAVRSAQKQWLTHAFARAVEGLSTEEQPLSAALEALVAKAPKQPPAPRAPGTVDFAAVYAAPRDDAPRLVLADALLEQGDPRGEFLALQLGATKDAKREKALLKAHGKQWLTPFGAMLGAEVTWRRGFPAEGLVKFRNAADAKKYGALPEWATFEALTWTEPRSPDHVEAAGFIGPAFKHLLHARNVHLPPLLGQPPFALRSVSGRVGDVEGLAKVVTSPSLPNLEAVLVRDHTFHAGWIDAVKTWGPVKELGVARLYPPRMRQVLAAAERSPLERLRWGEAVCFHRAADGLLSRLELLEPNGLVVGSYQLDAQLRALPEGLVTEVFGAPAGKLADAVAHLTKKQRVRPSLAAIARRALDLEHVMQTFFLADGRLAVVGQRKACLVDPARLEVVQRLEEPCELAVGPRDVLTSTLRKVSVRPLEGGAPRVLLEGQKLGQLTRSHDGTRGAVVDGQKVLVFDVRDGKVVFEGKGQYPALDATGARLVMRTRKLELHTLATPAALIDLPGWPQVPEFLPDGRLVQTIDRTVRVLRAGDEPLTLPGEYAVTVRVAGSPDGRQLALIDERGTTVFDGSTGKRLRDAPGARHGAFNAEGKLFLVGDTVFTEA